ncbi:MAG TPA: hypothetical protein VKT33_03645 [Candidatus Angelobacter sp.]|nr:hypothetical protein [Candidatus Angelobacter sp.]
MSSSDTERVSSPDLLVFRDDRRIVSGARQKSALLSAIHALSNTPSTDEIITPLLLAGEMECGVADTGGNSIHPWQTVTDQLAEALVMGGAIHRERLCAVLAQSAVPDQMEISTAEGFAYYALHPMAFAEVWKLLGALPQQLIVIGIRSIGTTLSAVTAAAARKHGTSAVRTTVRPGGHPYNRRASFSPDQLELIEDGLRRNAGLLIVDEGPGLSGSSFLSVAEALVRAGVPAANIVLVCSHQPDLDGLCAEDAPRRARCFRWVAAPAMPSVQAHGAKFIGGGEWRRRLIPDETLWPAAWISFERPKYLVEHGNGNKTLLKFLGLGPYGEQVRVREEQLAIAKFAPLPRQEAGGFASYPCIAGRPLGHADLSRAVIERLARYCAFRVSAFAAPLDNLRALEFMGRHNALKLGADCDIRLCLERPVIADGKMHPYEWLTTGDGEMLKTDSGIHGDDHFFPGVTDIAWDLAGVMIEWRMSPEQRRIFLETYEKLSGDAPAARINGFLRAYAAFRAAWSVMAAHALRGTDEQRRFERESIQYRAACSG